MTTEKKPVAVFGAFDIIHPGHINLLKQAKSLGSVFAVVARDNTIRKVKGKLPYFNEKERIKHLAELKLANNVILGKQGNPYEILNIIKPKIILLGPDQKIFVNRLQQELADRKLATTIKRAEAFHLDIFKSSQVRPSLEDSKQSGFLIINKPAGLSSHDVINALRKICQTKRIGHAGTLDPLATGILICGINKATKLLGWWQHFPKTYKATLELGKQSDTYDSEGKIIITNSQAISQSDLQKIITKFKGELWQQPPPFSAKKIKGKKAYQLARAGQTPKLKKQKIIVHSLHLTKFKYPQAQLIITCSSGTYIRSLINDIGNKLGVGAIMTALERTKIGNVALSEATVLENLSTHNWQKKMMPVSKLLGDINNNYLSRLD